MNNSYNLTDFIGMSITSSEEFEPYGYSSELEQADLYEEHSREAKIENMLLSHSKYYIYCE